MVPAGLGETGGLASPTRDCYAALRIRGSFTASYTAEPVFRARLPWEKCGSDRPAAQQGGRRGRSGAAQLRRRRNFGNLVAFAGRQEQVRIHAVLARVQIVVAARRRAYSDSCVPRSTIRPSSTTRICSARRMVESRCAITNVVRPFIRYESPSWIAASDSESRLEVASSRIRCADRPESRARWRRAGAVRRRA